MRRALTIVAVTAGLTLALQARAAEPAKAKDDVANAGKVIDVAPDGSSRVVKGEQGSGDEAGKAQAKPAGKAPKDAVSLADSCKARFLAQCQVLKRCMGPGGGNGADGLGVVDLPCEALLGMCDQVPGVASYSRKELDACVRGISSLRCDMKINPADPASMNLESKVPACKKVMAAEGGGQGGAPMPKGGQSIPTDLGGALGQ